MIARFTPKPRLCKIYNLPQTLICTDPKCTSSDILCPKCAKYEHQHYDQVLTLQEFINQLQHTVQQSRVKNEEDHYSINISAMIKNKKQEIQGMQLDLMEFLMKRLTEEKKKLFEVLGRIERDYQDKAHYYRRCQKNRDEILNYLDQLTRNRDTLELRLQTTSSRGTSRLKQNVNEFKKLSKIPIKKELINLEQTVNREINLSVNMKFFKTLRECLKEPSRQQPLLSVANPPLRRYSFRGKPSTGAISTRPTSAAEIKSSSLQTLRPIQARSHIQL